MLGDLLQGIGLAGGTGGTPTGPSGVPAISAQQAALLPYNRPPGAPAVPTPGAGAVQAALPPTAPAAAGAAVPTAPAAPAVPAAPKLGEFDPDKFQEDNPESVPNSLEDPTTHAFDLSKNPKAADWARQNGAQYGFVEDPSNPGHFVDGSKVAGAAPAAPAAHPAGPGPDPAKLQTAASSGPNSVSDAQAMQGGIQAMIANPSIDPGRKAAILSGIVARFSATVPGVKEALDPYIQHFMQQSDYPQSYKEWLLAGGDKSGMAYSEYISKSKDPGSYAEFTKAKDDGGFTGTYMEFLQKKAEMGKQPGTQVDVRTGETLSSGYAKNLQEGYNRITGPNGALYLLDNANTMSDQLNKGIISGFGKGNDAVNAFYNLAVNLGFGDAKKLANTQEYVDSAAQDFIAQARIMFPGSRITNADLNSSKLASGLDPSQQERVLYDMVALARKRGVDAISQHNDTVQRFKSAYPQEGGTAETMFTIKPEQIPADRTTPLITTQEQRDALPPNTTYRDDAGNIYHKQ